MRIFEPLLACLVALRSRMGYVRSKVKVGKNDERTSNSSAVDVPTWQD